MLTLRKGESKHRENIRHLPKVTSEVDPFEPRSLLNLGVKLYACVWGVHLFFCGENSQVREMCLR